MIGGATKFVFGAITLTLMGCGANAAGPMSTRADAPIGAVAVTTTGPTSFTERSTQEDPLVPNSLVFTSSSSTSTTSTTTTTLVWHGFPSRAVAPLTAAGEPVGRVAHVDTDDRVVFLTIDDGIHRDPRIPRFLADHHMPASLFLVRGPMLDDVEYFRQFAESGSTINSHTLNHPDLSGLPLDRQRHEICGMVDLIAEIYGFAGALFRPPYGSWDATTRHAAAYCGLAAVVTWNSELWEGHVDLAGRRELQPGDIFLTHFRTDLYDNLVAFADRIEAEGFTVALLDRYLLPPVNGE